MFTNADRDDIAAVGSQMTGLLADIAHHEVGDLADGWELREERTESEIDRLRTRLGELAAVAAEGLRELREIEIRERVRRVWVEAFEAGRIEDMHETDPGDPDQLNAHGVAMAFASAEAEIDAHPKLEMSFIEQMTETLDLRSLEDLVLERLLDTESHPDEPEDQALEAARVARAAAVVKALVLGVYANVADKYGLRIEVDSGP